MMSTQFQPQHKELDPRFPAYYQDLNMEKVKLLLNTMHGYSSSLPYSSHVEMPQSVPMPDPLGHINAHQYEQELQATLSFQAPVVNNMSLQNNFSGININNALANEALINTLANININNPNNLQTSYEQIDNLLASINYEQQNNQEIMNALQLANINTLNPSLNINMQELVMPQIESMSYDYNKPQNYMTQSIQTSTPSTFVSPSPSINDSINGSLCDQSSILSSPISSTSGIEQSIMYTQTTPVKQEFDHTIFAASYNTDFLTDLAVPQQQLHHHLHPQHLHMKPRSKSIGDISLKVKSKCISKKCSICGKIITRDMSRHLRIHEPVSRFKCIFPKEKCVHKTGQFNRPYDFKKHLLNYHFRFDDNSVKKQHNLCAKLDHTGQCYCGKKFTAEEWLDNHILKENKDGDYECAYLRKHYKQHGIAPPSQEFITSFSKRNKNGSPKN
ncbi:hypothetical protein BVG19_g2863 [[Candida] boidinii]|nr:hypothetical protein BVG19_g2863 [[Candida] boidinii]OWB48591.1 nucleic acid binding protein [[Candida] boidinii]